MRTTFLLIRSLGALLLTASTLFAHAADGRFYDPRNAASPTGYTIGYELFRTIGCPGRGLLDTPCPVEKTAEPVAKTVDSDGDGVPDAQDKCPNTPAGWKVNADGCPMDTDGDGVPDPIDRCPNVFAQTADGCPDASVQKPAAGSTAQLAPTAPTAATSPVSPVPATQIPLASQSAPVGAISPAADYTVGSAVGPVEIPRRLVLEGVNFDFDKSTLRQADRDLIDKDAATLKDWGDIKVEVSGHTDSVGSDRYNQGLSLRRAHTVRNYLISKGISGDRLIAKGYGELQPIASNDTDEGRFQNRRVELNQISE